MLEAGLPTEAFGIRDMGFGAAITIHTGEELARLAAERGTKRFNIGLTAAHDVVGILFPSYAALGFLFRALYDCEPSLHMV
ncbi:MAG: hypothetical protein ACPG4T_18495 [Nannocystaceae bacterium]